MPHTVWRSLGAAPSAPVQREGNRVLQGQREAADRGGGGGGDGNYADNPPPPFTPYSLVAMATGPSCRTALEVAVGGCRGPAEIKETVWNQ